jgi:hypothetical protein
LCCALAGPALAAGSLDTCRAQSTERAPTIVELYTSEGCSSCPPADRWLSSLKSRPDVLALSFHVTYWDRLGWPDRFASADFTARQYDLAHRSGSAQVYTPQVLVNGRDWRAWPQLPAAAPGMAPTLVLAREGDTVTAQIQGLASAGGQFAGYWAVLEDRHHSQVRAGENAGMTLRHDHVVRLLKPVPAWAAALGSSTQLRVSRGAPEYPRRVVFVVADAATQRPLQAVALGC